MALDRLSDIENVLRQMRAVADMAAGGGAAAAQPAAGGGFAAELQKSLARVSDMQHSADAQARAFELGAPGVSLNNVMIDMQKANIAFQTTIQVRNRMVAAYQEIASMAV
jgi:flagellar hook-basal body complex protein FliE